MKNDAKLGLLAGLAAVIVVAVVYYPKAQSTAAAPAKPTAIAGTPAPAAMGMARSAPAAIPDLDD